MNTSGWQKKKNIIIVFYLEQKKANILGFFYLADGQYINEYQISKKLDRLYYGEHNVFWMKICMRKAWPPLLPFQHNIRKKQKNSELCNKAFTGVVQTWVYYTVDRQDIIVVFFTGVLIFTDRQFYVFCRYRCGKYNILYSVLHDVRGHNQNHKVWGQIFKNIFHSLC